jgi:uncharacterized protein
MSLGTGLRNLAASATSAVDATLNETPIRLAVTGLSRAGKTVFITSLIRNLLALGQGRGTLPLLQAGLEKNGASRLRQVRILPPGAAAIASFDYAGKFAELASQVPSWPPRTEGLAQIALELEVDRTGALWSKLGPRRIRLEILDYPGEWLLDLPLLTRSYATWSKETMALLRRPPREAVFGTFLAFLEAFDPNGPASDALIQRGHGLYRQALHDARERFGLRYLQPGRFLCPGPRDDAPFMWFFPHDRADATTARGSAGALLRDRYEAYKADMRAGFFDTHFQSFDRQIVLVDVLGALHSGREAFDDTARVIEDIAAGMNYGWNLVRPVYEIGAAAVRVGGQLLPGTRAAGALSRAFSSRRIERLAYVATKADHVPAMRRDNLCNLLRALAETAQEKLGRIPVSYHAAAAVLSTEDGTATIDGRAIEVVYGVPLKEKRARPFYPGDVPSARPRDSFWTNRYFELPVFKPPRIDPTGVTGIPHLGLDEVLSAVLKDVL